MSDTIAAVATGAGVSAIGIVRVSGPLSVSLMDALFRPADGKAMSQHRDRQLVYGKLLDEKGRTLDLCLCTLSRAPRSYTGEDTAELQCHGSPVVLRSALEALFALGARQAAAGEFTKRAFLNGRMDLTQAEAVVDIIDAETPRGAKCRQSARRGDLPPHGGDLSESHAHLLALSRGARLPGRGYTAVHARGIRRRARCVDPLARSAVRHVFPRAVS